MTEIRVLDALTVTVLLEHLEPDDAIVTVWHTRYWGANHNVALDDVYIHPAPVKATMCLACLLNLVGTSRSSDGRADLLRLVKEGSVQIAAVAERDDITPCPKCATIKARPF